MSLLHKTENNARVASDIVNSSYSMLLGIALSFVCHNIIIEFCCNNHYLQSSLIVVFSIYYFQYSTLGIHVPKEVTESCPIHTQALHFVNSSFGTPSINRDQWSCDKPGIKIPWFSLTTVINKNSISNLSVASCAGAPALEAWISATLLCPVSFPPWVSERSALFPGCCLFSSLHLVKKQKFWTSWFANYVMEIKASWGKLKFVYIPGLNQSCWQGHTRYTLDF